MAQQMKEITPQDIKILEQQLTARIADNSLQGLSGLDALSVKSFGKKAKKIGKKIGQRSRRLVKTVAETPQVAFRVTKTAVVTPWETAAITMKRGAKAGARYAQKDVKKTARKVTRHASRLGRDIARTGEAVAPVAVIGAAAYFGGPAVMAALKGSTAATALTGAKFTVAAQHTLAQQKAQKRAMKKPNNVKRLFRNNQAVFARFKKQYPQEFQRLKHESPEVILQSPVVQELASELTRAEVENNLGVSLDSWEANALNDAQIMQASQELAADSAAPEKGKGALLAVAAAIPFILLV